MAAFAQEQPDSRSGSSKYDRHSQRDWHFHVKGSDDLDDHWTALSPLLPTIITDAFSGVLLRISELKFQRIGYQVWDYHVLFEDRAKIDEKRQLDTGSYRFSFSTTGGTARILTSLETISQYAPAGQTAPDFHQAIGVTREGDVQGLDVVVPALRFSIEYRQPEATITDAYVRTLEAMTGTVNDATFFGRPAGEVLYLGSDGQQATDNDPTVKYDFVRLPNIAGQTIGDIVNVAKKGHEYLWVLFEEVEDAAAKYVPKRPKAVYVERVYDLADFSALGIGT